MAGHSKWNNIKNRKGAVDKKRAKIFGQFAKQIRVAVKEGQSGDPKSNAGLRLILEKARAANMPKENIERAIERGMGKTATGASIQEIVYEGFGPGGVGLLIVAHTDNANRTSSELKFILSRGGGSLGSPGSAHYLFERDLQTGEYIPTMPFELDNDTLAQLSTLLETLEENEAVEQVFPAVSRALLDSLGAE
ncbi:YebC/PmpR family DNA-binding transcriptional regulator [Candidatus Woesebacteria bacterium]|nr:YebC/PmpR family DNA-binding transcriptional regulator [Candidatus Woesebacteria bacterium]